MLNGNEITSVPQPNEDTRPMLLDLHVLLTDRIPSGWVEQCLDSIDTAVMCAPFGVQLHLADEVIGDEFAARRTAYGKGVAPWVAQVDVDDWLAGDVLCQVWPAMQAGTAVLTKAMQIDITAKTRCVSAVGFGVYPRALLDRVDWSNARGACCVKCELYRLAGPHQSVDSIGITRRVGYRSLQTQALEKRHAVG